MAQAISDSYEYTVKKKIEGAFLLRRVLFISLYVLYVIAFITVGFLTRLGVPLMALIPVTLWIIIYFTFPYCSIEYEYSLMDGYITFSTIYGSRKRKENFSFRISTFSKVAPYNRDCTYELEQFAPVKVYNALSSMTPSSDAYYATFTDESNKKCVFIFEATNRALRIIKYYNNENTLMSVVSI